MNAHANDHSHNAAFPLLPLITAGMLIAFALGMVGLAQIEKLHSGKVADSGATPVLERDLNFDDNRDGSIAVIDAHSGNVIDTIAPGTNGFLRGTLRGLARERKREGFDRSTPFQLSETRAGHLILRDQTTARFVDLGSFGPTNAAVFAKLLTEGPDVARNVPAANPS